MLPEAAGTGPADHFPCPGATRVAHSAPADNLYEHRLRAAVESAPSGLLMTDQLGNIVLVNRQVEVMFGYPREELLGKPVHMLVPHRLRERHPAYRESFMADPRVRAMGAGRDLYGVRKDGVEVPVEIGLTPVPTPEGMFVLAAIVDIRARKSAEERFRIAVESSPNGMVMVDESGRILLVNREVERLFGYAREELLGQSIEMLVPERFRSRHPMFRSDFFDKPQARAMGAGRELYGLRKDGTEVPVEIGLNPIRTETSLLVLSSIVDISARKEAEALRERLEADLRQAQKMEALGTLAGGIAHDFNNILATIMGYAELIGVAPSPERAAADVRELLAAASRGKAIVEQILAFSRRQEPTLRPMALESAVDRATRLLRGSLPASVEIRTATAPGVPRVLADASAMEQLLMNLCTNGAQAMPRGGVLDVSLEPFYVRDSVARARPDLREGPYVMLTVRDTGIGMDVATRERVFEPFFTTKPPGEGTGLGMSIVHSIVKNHQGTVEIESAVGAGTVIRCFFPGIEAEVEDIPKRVDHEPHGNGEHILLVEDNVMLAEVGARRVTAIGYRVTVVTDSRAALARFLERPEAFDLVLTDYLMPVLNGLELAARIRAVRPDLPIVLQTGYMEAMPEETVAAAGIRQVVHKPVTLAQLAQVLSAVMQERRVAGS